MVQKYRINFFRNMINVINKDEKNHLFKRKGLIYWMALNLTNKKASRILLREALFFSDYIYLFRSKQNITCPVGSNFFFLTSFGFTTTEIIIVTNP